MQQLSRVRMFRLRTASLAISFPSQRDDPIYEGALSIATPAGRLL